MASVTLKNIRKVYSSAAGSRWKAHSSAAEGIAAVQDFSMEIHDREFVVLVGPSGCGKSTTLRMIAGLEEITSGELYIGDELVNDLEPKDRDVAMVFQNYALYPHMSVYDNMAFALKKRIKSKEEIKRKVFEAAEILGITEYLDRKPKNLSGGQRQRVAIGRAIVRSPKVMLLDEPLSNLDAKLRNQMRTELMRLRKKIDTTFVYVTHDQTEAMTLGDRIVVMKDGLVLQIGTPQEVFDSPSSIFVASFIGTPQMNFLDGMLSVRSGRYSVRINGVEMPVPEDMNEHFMAKGQKDMRVRAGIRPDSVKVSEREGLFPAFAGVSEHMGNTVNLHLDFAGYDVVSVMEAKDDDGRVIEFTPDTEVFFSFSPSAMHVFDPESGINIGK